MLAVLVTLGIVGSTFQGKKVEAAFWSVEHKISVSGGVNRQEDRLYLFKDGVALRGFYQQGIDTLYLATLQRDDRYGTWTKAGNKLTIRWGGGANSQSFTTDKGNLVNGSITWRPLKLVDGLRLNGLFAREDPKHDGAQLMLRSDGTFAFRNAHRVNLIDLSKVAPDTGAGWYEIRNWTIILTYGNAQRTSLSFELPHTEDAKTASFIYMATQNFHRWPGELPDRAIDLKAAKIGDISLVHSPGWIRTDDKQTDTTTLSAPGLPQGVLCSVTFTPPQDFKGSAEEWHSSIWTPLTEGAKLTGGAKREKIGPFLRSWARVDRQDRSIWCSVYTTVSKGKGLVAMFATTREDLFGPLFPYVEAMMKGATLP